MNLTAVGRVRLEGLEGGKDHLLATGFPPEQSRGAHSKLPGDASVSEAIEKGFIFFSQCPIRMQL